MGLVWDYTEYGSVDQVGAFVPLPCPEGLEFLCTNPSYFYRGAGVWVGFGVNVSARAEAVVVKWVRYTPSETFL